MNTARKKSKSRFGIGALGLAAVTIVVVTVAIFYPRSPVIADPEIVAYKSPSCGCCSKWIKHLEENGFSVKSHNRRDMEQVKAAMGIPSEMSSCHTAKIDGYLIEGHVPADLIKRLLAEKPDIAGLAVPGMPMGSPGMEGPVKDSYNIMAFGQDQTATVYAKR